MSSDQVRATRGEDEIPEFVLEHYDRLMRRATRQTRHLDDGKLAELRAELERRVRECELLEELRANRPLKGWLTLMAIALQVAEIYAREFAGVIDPGIRLRMKVDGSWADERSAEEAAKFASADLGQLFLQVELLVDEWRARGLATRLYNAFSDKQIDDVDAHDRITRGTLPSSAQRSAS